MEEVEEPAIAARLKAPCAGAIAGILFSILLIISVVLLRLSVPDTYAFTRTLAYELVNVYALRMAGVFMFSTCTLAIRIGIFPRWMAFLGYALAIFLLLSIGRFGRAPLVFPLWALMISVYMLFANFRPQLAIEAEP